MDAPLRLRMQMEIRRIVAQLNKTVLFVTRDLDEAGTGAGEKLAELLNPFIMTFYSIPKIALAPLFIIWVFIVWVFTGLRLSVPYAMIGAIVGEMIAANRGLGYRLSHASSQFNTAGVFAALAAIITMSVC